MFQDGARSVKGSNTQTMRFNTVSSKTPSGLHTHQGFDFFRATPKTRNEIYLLKINVLFSKT